MSDRKLDLPDDLLSSKLEPSGGTIQEKGSIGLHDESKDQGPSDSSIPLSPQWLYSKPSDSKMIDLRSPTSLSLGTSNDPSQKDGWRLDASEDKKDWRKIAAENESNRRWREEERETGLLGARRDRRKMERRADSGSMRDIMDGRNLPSSDRWHDGGNRNTGHEARRDSKWSSRWGPDDKEKEARTEKKTDMEKEREDAQSDTHSSVVSNRLPSERDSESRDKWRPRHRMEVHSSGSGPSSYRAAPGFGLERGRVEGSNTGGFAVGRGRSNATGRSSSIGGGLTVTAKGSTVIGKPNLSTIGFCYPRAKLLDIYRCKKLDVSLLAMPSEMEETPAITQVDFVEPLAFVPPNAEEDAILSDIWKGKVTSSEVVYNSFKKGRSAENLSVGSNELTEMALGPANEVTAEDTIYDSNKSNGNLSWSNSQLTALNDSMVNYLGRDSQHSADGLTEQLGKRDSVYGNIGSTAASQLNSIENSQMLSPSMATLKKFDDIDFATSLGVGPEICKDSSSLVLSSSEQKQDSSFSLSGINNETDDLERTSPFDDMYFYYIDPQGNTQGPFQGADIISWFEQGYFGLDLPVRLADAPEGTRFQNLGAVMPHLTLRGGNLSSELDQPGSFRRNSEPGSSVATISDGADPSLADNLHRLSSELNSSVRHAQSRTSESEVPLQLPHSDGQRFHDFVAQDEEVFPGRLGNASSPNAKPSGIELDPFAVSIGQSLLSGDLREPSQSDSKLHPFGLLWSELQGSHATFGSHPDPVSVAEKWSDSHRQDTHSGHSLFTDAAAGHSLPSVEQEPNRFDLTKQLMLQQIQQQQQQQQQQQLQQRNAMPSPAYLNESLIERIPSQLHHQQPANPSARDIEHLMAMQLQHQREVQLHQQQLQQQHQLHQLQQQQLLQEQQESQVRHMLLEQMLRGQIADPGLPQARLDPIAANNALDKVLLEQQLLHELQRTHHHPRQFGASMEDIAQAKFGQMSHQDQQRDLLQLLSRAQHGQISSLEHQILQQEQLLARQSSLGLRQQTNIEDDRHMGSFWPVNDNDHLFRGAATNHRPHPSGIIPLDFYQRQQRSSHEDQLSHMQRNPSIQDQLLGLYDNASLPFERSLSLPSSAMSRDVVNAIARAQALDMQDLTAHMQAGDQLGAFSSGIQLQNQQPPVVPSQFLASQLDANEGQWPERMGHQSSDLLEMQQLRINAERQNRESENRMHAKDLGSWMSGGSENDKSRQLLMELLHQKPSHQHADSGHITDARSFDQRASSTHFSRSSSLDPPFNAIADQGANLSSSYQSNAFEPTEVRFGNEQVSNVEYKERSPFISESGLGLKGHSFLSGVGGATSQAAFADLVATDDSSINKEFFDVEGKKHGLNIQGMMKGSFPDAQVKAEQPKSAASVRGEMPAGTHSRHSSTGSASGNPVIYSEKIGHQSFYGEDSVVNKVPLQSKAQNSILLRRPPVPHSSASQDGLSEVIPNALARTKSSVGSANGGMMSNQGTDTTESGNRDGRFRRTSSFGEAEMSEPLYLDMLKSNAKKTSNPDIHGTAGGSESSDGAQGSRSGKKKGKKGKQIDPAFLGFKVTSNRIMMGEIQRVED